MSDGEKLPPNVYENLEEAQFRLSGSVVGYDGYPAYIHDVRAHSDGIFRLTITRLPLNGEGHAGAEDIGDEDLPASKAVRKRIDSPKFNRFRPIQLGMMNLFDATGQITGRIMRHASYAVRIPVRRGSQGLKNESFDCRMLFGGQRTQLNHAMKSEAFSEMSRNVYPTFDEAMDRLAPDSSIAVTREFAVAMGADQIVSLYHKNTVSGLVHRGTILLLPSHTFLRESIIENPNLPNNIGEY